MSLARRSRLLGCRLQMHPMRSAYARSHLGVLLHCRECAKGAFPSTFGTSARKVASSVFAPCRRTAVPAQRRCFR
eukprot:1584235-Lingulodinium_polyedra.AAC.1